MRRRTHLALWIGAAVAATAAMVPAIHAFGADDGSVTATFVAGSDWGSGHEAKVTVANGTGDTVGDWKLTFTLPSGTTIGNFWDADVVRQGDTYVVTRKNWASPLAAGAKQTWGYIGTGGFGQPVTCTINGNPCAGGHAAPTGSGSSGPTSPDPQPTDPQPEPTSTEPTEVPSPSGDGKVVGYFTEWGVYGRNYHVKNIVTSKAAEKLTHILYAFGNVTNGRCAVGDAYADYDKAYSAGDSVDGVADTWDNGALRGNFGQLRRLKKAYPKLKVVWSFGGWTWSGGFTQAAADPAGFAESCHSLVEDPRWADVFDGIDIDWEYPNACGVACDKSGPDAYRKLMAALRAKFGTSALVTSAITADANSGGKIDAADYAGAAQDVDWFMPMTYDFFGTWDATGPTAPHSPLSAYSGIPQQSSTTQAAIAKLKAKGIPASKLLLGVGFYGRGWTGVSQSAPGGTATGPAPGTYEQGIEDYKVLKDRCPATGTVGGTAYAHCGSQWWSYDTPDTIGDKMGYARSQGLGGSFFWELSGDSPNGELVTAIHKGLG